MRMFSSWYRVPRRWASRLPVALFLILPVSTWAQAVLPQDTAAGSRGLPSGLRLTSVSAWVGRDSLQVQNAAATPLERYLLGYGGGFDAGLYLPGRTSRASIDYSLSYNGNTSYEALNGFDHRLFFSWTNILTRSLSVSVSGVADSTTVQGFLFQQPATSAPDL